jgi:predicted porin
VALQAKFGRHTFEVDVNQKKWVETGTSVAGRFGSYKNRGYLVGWDARWSSQWRTSVHWVKSTEGECTRVGMACSTAGLSGTQTSAGIAYNFSRRTYLFFMASWVKNDYSAQFNTSAQQSPNVGEDLMQYALGLHTSF